MTRPHIVRADTLDLQDHEAPSAKDHGGLHPVVNSGTTLAPHQEATIRHMEDEQRAQQDLGPDTWVESGRSSHEGSELLDEDSEFYQNSAMDSRGSPANHDGKDEDDDMEGDDDGDDNGDDDMLDKISSSPSIDDEDIDFEFVYALHTFVATVEGQANATKGDTMVLLDDSNSYWWLVRVVKDSSIGYLPAEHIETPTERLARLNKHRNIDLSATMLGDNTEKSKNPLKKAMRRRNAKMVQFTTPTYYEPSEVDWSEEEEDEEADSDADMVNAKDTNSAENQHPEASNVGERSQGEETTERSTPDLKSKTYTGQDLDVDDVVMVDRPSEESDASDGLRKNKGGKIRNTDSFFKDDTVEPRKITLTPNILREGSEDSTPRTSESKERSSAGDDSLEQMAKSPSPTADRDRSSKEERRRAKDKAKEKRPGMLSGLFKKKEKKIKVDEAAGGIVAKQDGELVSPTASGPISELSPRERPSSTRKVVGGKLVKSPPPTSSSITGSQNSSSVSVLTTPPNGSSSAPSAEKQVLPMDSSDLSRTMPNRPPPGPPADMEGTQLRGSSAISETNVEDGGNDSVLAVGAGAIAAAAAAGSVAALNVVKNAASGTNQHTDSGIPPPLQRTTTADLDPRVGKLEATSQDNVEKQRVAESVNGVPSQYNAQMRNNLDTFVNEDIGTQRSDSPISPATPTNESTPDFANSPSDATKTSTNLSTPVTMTLQNSHDEDNYTPKSDDRLADDSVGAWDGAALKKYLDSNFADDVRNLMVIVHDKNGVKPVSNDHPTMRELGYHTQQKQLDGLSKQLDDILLSFWAKKTGTGKGKSAYLK